MKSNERGQDAFSDAKIDSLLKDFFENEMPAELRRSTNDVRLVSVSKIGARQSSRPAGWLGLSVVAASLLTVVVLMSQPGNRPSGDTELTGSAVNRARLNSSRDVADRTEPAEATDSDSSNVKITVTEDFSDVDQYETANGPVEQRSKLRIKNVSIFDPETGAKVELSLPELEIEIFPIDDAKNGTDGEKDE